MNRNIKRALDVEKSEEPIMRQIVLIFLALLLMDLILLVYAGTEIIKYVVNIRDAFRNYTTVDSYRNEN